MAAYCTDLAAIGRMRRHVEQELGPTGVVAAFAGAGRARPGPVAQTTEEEWHSTVHGNLTATFLTLKSFLPSLIERWWLDRLHGVQGGPLPHRRALRRR